MIQRDAGKQKLSNNLIKKIAVIMIGSIVAAYGITLALYAGFGGATLLFCGKGFQEHFI